LEQCRFVLGKEKSTTMEALLMKSNLGVHLFRL
jgi:hypothetical protein